MPTYVFTSRAGVQTERFIPFDRVKVSGVPKSIRCGRTVFYHDIAAEHTGTRRKASGDQAYPYYSDFMGCHPEQVGEVRELLRQHGAGAHVTNSGEIEIRSRGHRKRVMAALGYYDRNGGYGDRAPQNF